MFSKVKRDFIFFHLRSTYWRWMNSSVSVTRTLLALNWSTACAPEESFEHFNQMTSGKIENWELINNFPLDTRESWDSSGGDNINSYFNDTRDIGPALYTTTNDSVMQFFLFFLAHGRMSKVVLPHTRLGDDFTETKRKLKVNSFQFTSSLIGIDLFAALCAVRNWNLIDEITSFILHNSWHPTLNPIPMPLEASFASTKLSLSTLSSHFTTNGSLWMKSEIMKSFNAETTSR